LGKSKAKVLRPVFIESQINLLLELKTGWGNRQRQNLIWSRPQGGVWTWNLGGEMEAEDDEGGGKVQVGARPISSRTKS
jgi:hypothetical protein